MKSNNTTSSNEANRTVLMVDGHGQIRTIRKFHQKMWIGLLLVLCSVLLAMGAGWLYVDSLQTQQELQQRIDTLRTQLEEVEHQKDLLLARAVKAEARITTGEPAQAPPPRPKAAPKAVPAGKAKSVSPPIADAAPASPAKAKAKPSPAPPVKAVKPEPVISVAVEKLKVAYRTPEKALSTEFVIRNTGNTQAQGRAVVVLSSSEGENTPRLSLPPVPLKNDRPRGNRGRRFSITRFMRLNLQRKVAEPGLRYDTAEVFVFDMKGRLLQEKTFTVAVSTPVAEPPKPVAEPPKPVAEPPKPAAQPPQPGAESPQPAVEKPPAQPAASVPAADQTTNPILAIPSNSQEEPQGGQED